MQRRSFFSKLIAAFTIPVVPAAAMTLLRDRDGQRVEFENGTLTCNHPCAPWVEVIDTRTGKKLELVREVNIREGWANIYKRTPDGKFVFGEDDRVAVERVRGSFTLRLRSGAPFVLEAAA